MIDVNLFKDLTYKKVSAPENRENDDNEKPQHDYIRNKESSVKSKEKYQSEIKSMKLMIVWDSIGKANVR